MARYKDNTGRRVDGAAFLRADAGGLCYRIQTKQTASILEAKRKHRKGKSPKP